MHFVIYIGIALRNGGRPQKNKFLKLKKRWKGIEIRWRRTNAVVKNIFQRYFVPFFEESFDLNFPVENNKNSAKRATDEGKRLKRINDTKFRASFWNRIIKEYLLQLKWNVINYIYVYFGKISKENCDYSFKRKTLGKIFMTYFIPLICKTSHNNSFVLYIS